MHLDEVRSDLKHGNMRGIRRAFAALVTDDDHIEGLGTGHEDAPEQALVLLTAIIEALRSDQSPLPEALAGVIGFDAPTAHKPLDFGDAAAAVLASLPRWANLLTERFPAASGSEG